MKKLLALTLACAFSTSFAYADTPEWRVNAATGISHAGDPSTGDSDEDLKLDSSGLIHLSLNKFQRVNSDGANLYYEFLYIGDSIEVDAKTAGGSNDYKTSIDAQHFHIGGTYEWADNEFFNPYFAASLGASHYAAESSDSDTFFSMSAGLGGHFWLMDNLALRIEARALGTVIDSSTKIFCKDNTCYFGIEGDLWWQNQATVGITYGF